MRTASTSERPGARRRTSPAWVLTCDHAGRAVPPAFRPWFDSDEARAALRSHRGWDPGAMALCSALADALGLPALAHRTTRLLVDVNRSPGHPRVFSEFSRGMPEPLRQRALVEQHGPYRREVATDAEKARGGAGLAVHLAVHSFTPVLKGVTRDVDVGLLYDPARPLERHLARVIKGRVAALDPALRIRMNRPYRGVSDGIPTWLRRELGVRYLGLELEVNQRLIASTSPRVREGLTNTLERALAGVRATWHPP